MNRRKFTQQVGAAVAGFFAGLHLPLMAASPHNPYKKVERLEPDGSTTKLFDGFRSVKKGDQIRWAYQWPIPPEAPFITVLTNPVPEKDGYGRPCFAIDYEGDKAVEFYEMQDIRFWERMNHDQSSAAVSRQES